MLYQWQYNPTIETRTMGIVTEMLGNVIETLANVIETLKQLPAIIICICYYVAKLAEHFPSSLGRFIECRKCNITQALVLCLIYSYALTRPRALRALGHHAYISG